MTTLGITGFVGGETVTVVFAANFHKEQSIGADDGHGALITSGIKVSGVPTLIAEEEPISSVTALESRDH